MEYYEDHILGLMSGKVAEIRLHCAYGRKVEARNAVADLKHLVKRVEDEISGEGEAC